MKNNTPQITEDATFDSILLWLEDINNDKESFIQYLFKHKEQIDTFSNSHRNVLYTHMRSLLSMDETKHLMWVFSSEVERSNTVLLRILWVEKEKDDLQKKVSENIDDKSKILKIIKDNNSIFTILPTFYIWTFYEDIRMMLDIDDKSDPFLLLLQNTLWANQIKERIEINLEQKHKELLKSRDYFEENKNKGKVLNIDNQEESFKTALTDAQEFNSDFYVDDDFYEYDVIEDEPKQAIQTKKYL